MEDRFDTPETDGSRHAEPVLDERPLEGGPPVAPDRTWWGEIDRRHRNWILAAVMAGVVVLAVGIGVGVAMLGESLTSTSDDGGRLPGLPPRSQGGTSSVPATETTASGGATATPQGAAIREPFVAYRAQGAVWVVKEDGSDPRRIATSSDGPFSLSPDARTLAIVDADSRTLTLVDVESKTPTLVGAAVAERPDWSPDSSFVVFTTQEPASHDTRIERVARDGSARAVVGTGSVPRVAPDGSIVAVSASRSATGTPVAIFAAAGNRLVGTGIFVNAVAPCESGIILADADGVIREDRRPPSVKQVGYDGRGQRVIVAAPVTEGLFFGEIDCSPDGSWIAYAETGDDGYSRMFSVRASGGKPLALSLRRDDYIVGWSAGGSEILFVEGNELANETPRLMAVRPDGSGRRTIVEDAGL